MAKAIEVGTIGEDLRSQPDQIWTSEALPATATITSGEFKLGQTMAGVEIKVICSKAVTTTGAMTINLKTSATSSGTFTTQASKTVVIGSYAVGDMLAGLILPREVCDELYTIVTITTVADESAGEVDAYPVFVS